MSNDILKNHRNAIIDAERPYGVALGQTRDGVEARSNSSSTLHSSEPILVGNVITGLPWQCIEFARRWLLLTQGLIFDDVPLAANIWSDIKYLVQVSDKRRVSLDSFSNGSVSNPVKGDLLIYSEAYLGTGHIAIIVETAGDNGLIRVAEQNYSNRLWPGDYSREIPLLEFNGRWWILDPYLTGWKRRAKS